MERINDSMKNSAAELATWVEATIDFGLYVYDPLVVVQIEEEQAFVN
jgi:hypothetical protein